MKMGPWILQISQVHLESTRPAGGGVSVDSADGTLRITTDSSRPVANRLMLAPSILMWFFMMRT